MAKAHAHAQAQAQAHTQTQTQVAHQAGAGPSAPYSDSSPPPASAPAPPAPSTSPSSAPNLQQPQTQQQLQQQQQQQQHKRVYQACIPCRRRKVRCDLGSVDNPHEPPCVRCRRESKECYFSATRRKRKNDEDEAEEAAREEDAYILRNGRKRPHTDASPPPLIDRRIYSDQPLTPGGSVGRHQPLRRPGPGEHARSESRSSVTGASRGRSGTEFGGADEPNTPLENYEARTVMRKEVYGPHDALDLLYKAATDKTHEHGGGHHHHPHHHQHHHSHGPSPQLGVQTPSLNVTDTANDGVRYAQHAAAHHQRVSVHDAPIDPQLTGNKGPASRVSQPAPAHAQTEAETEADVDALRAWTRFRFVRAGWFTAHEAIDYIDYYYKYLSPLTPISPPTFQDSATHLTLLTEEPILAVTLLTIASRYRKLPGTGGLCRANAIHEQLWTYLRGMIERVIWGQEAFGGGFCGSGADESQTSSTAPWRGLRKGSLRTLGTIESLMILTEWHPRALHFPPAEAIDELMIPAYDTAPPAGVDGNNHPAISMGGRRVESWLEPAWRSDRMCWMLLNAAMGLAYELGVFDNIDELLDSEAISRPEYLEETYRLRADRIKRLILIYLSQLAGRLGWTNMVPENLRKTTTMSRRRPTSSAVEGTTPGTTVSSLSAPFNYIPNLELDDAIIHCWAGISNAMHIGNERLFGSRKHTTDIITTGRYVELLKEFQPMLQDWRTQFERYQLPPYIRHILTIEYEYVRIYVNSLSLQAVVERCANFASGQSGAVPNNAASSSSAPTTGNQLSPKTQDIYGKMPIGNIGGVSAADQEYIREVMEGSRNLLRTVVEGLLPDDYLKHAPVRTYFRIISGAMFLLKTFALGATRHDVEVSIRLMDSTVEALRTCVVDDVHLGIRFADLLENLTMRLRNRFIYVANPTNQPQANSADGRSPMPEAGLGGSQHAPHGLGINGAEHVGWPKMHAPGTIVPTGAVHHHHPLANMPMLERAVTPANISAIPFDIPSNFPMPSSFNGGPGPGPTTPAMPGLSAGSAPDNHSASNNSNLVSDMFGGGSDGPDWAAGPANDMWFLPAGPAFFQSVGGPGDSGVGMSAEGINVGGMDLLDYMAMDQYPMDGSGPL